MGGLLGEDALNYRRAYVEGRLLLRERALRCDLFHQLFQTLHSAHIAFLLSNPSGNYVVPYTDYVLIIPLNATYLTSYPGPHFWSWLCSGDCETVSEDDHFEETFNMARDLIP